MAADDGEFAFHSPHQPMEIFGSGLIANSSSLTAPTAVHRIERLCLRIDYRIVTMRDPPSVFAVHKDERQLVLSLRP